ncbi:pentapeptide repeat-containing protein [Streptomyces sp. NPDC002309]
MAPGRRFAWREPARACLIAAGPTGTDLCGADLIGADLRDADLTDADLTGAFFLTQPQVDAARASSGTGCRAPSHGPRTGRPFT